MTSAFALLAALSTADALKTAVIDTHKAVTAEAAEEGLSELELEFCYGKALLDPDVPCSTKVTAGNEVCGDFYERHVGHFQGIEWIRCESDPLDATGRKCATGKKFCWHVYAKDVDETVNDEIGTKWVVAAQSESCDDTCDKDGPLRKCDRESMSGLIEANQQGYDAVFAGAGTTCTAIKDECGPFNCETMGAPYLKSGEIADGKADFCYYGTNRVAPCSAVPTAENHLRLCACTDIKTNYVDLYKARRELTQNDIKKIKYSKWSRQDSTRAANYECTAGFLSVDRDVCCDNSCTACNAAQCGSSDEALSKKCCPATILEEKVLCGKSPCIVIKASMNVTEYKTR